MRVEIIMSSERRTKKEDYVYVLAIVPDIKSREDILQVIGERYFSLLEVVPLRRKYEIGERLYIGKGEKRKIEKVLRRINYANLSQEAETNLIDVLEKIIEKNENFFVNFFNKAGPITTRLHSLQLIPGIGKTLIWKIIEERKKKPFESFEDIVNRTKIKDPRKMLAKRIIEELKGDCKRYLFVTNHHSKGD